MSLPTPAANLSNDELIRLYLDVESETVEKATSSVYKLGVGLEETKSKMAGFGQAGLQAGRALQDFTQGGIGGILNNLEGIAQALGGGPGLAGVLTAVGVAAFIAKPYLGEFFAALSGAGSNDVPKALELLDRFNDELKTNKDRLDELKKQQKLTNDELVEYNARLRNTAELEKDVDEERKKRKDRDKLKEVKGDEEQAKERAENVMAGLEGRAGDVEKELRASAPKLLDDVQKQLRKTPEGTPEHARLMKLYGKLWDISRGPNKQEATEDLIAGAGIRGSEADIQTILSILPADSKFRGIFEGGTQANIEAGDASLVEAEDMGRRLHEGSSKFRRAKQQQVDQDKLSQRLNEEGRDVENRTNQERERQRDHEQTKAEHDAKMRREKDAREGTPLAKNRRQQEAEENRYLGAVQQNTSGLTADQQRMVAKHLQGNHEAGLDMAASFEQALAYAIAQTRAQIAQGIQSGLRRQSMGSETRGAN